MAEIPQGIVLKRHRDLVGRSADVWWRRGLLALWMAFVLCGLANLFGQLPLTSTVRVPAAALTVYAPDRVRGGLLYNARFHIDARRELKKALITLDPGWFEGMQVNSITPQPIGEASSNDKTVLDLGHIAAGKSLQFWIEFQVNPTNVGHRSQNVQLADGSTPIASVHRSISVFP
jgi:hypothetical protein